MRTDKILSAFVCCLLIFALFAGGIPASAENTLSIGKFTAGEVQSLIDGIVAFKETESGADSIQRWINTALTDNAGEGAEWYIIALAQSGGGYDFSSYAAALSAYAAQNTISSATTRQKLALALIACGRPDDPFVQSTIDDSIGEQGIMSWVFGLHLLSNGCVSAAFTSADIVEKLLSLRLSDGGWALTGDNSDVDVTAMTVTALAPYYAENDEVKTAADGALEFLSEKQLDNGAFSSYGNINPESAAQVVVALSSLGVDPLTDTAFIVDGGTLFDGMARFQLSDSGFSHLEGGEYNNMATSQVFYASIAAARVENGLGPLFVFDKTASANENDETSGIASAENEKEIESDSENDGETAAETESDSENNVENAAEAESDSENAITTAVESSRADNGVSNTGIKLWLCVGIAVLAAAVCVVMLLKKKRSVKNYISVIVITALLIIIVASSDFRSAGDYYSAESVSDPTGTVTLTIRCDTVAGRTDSEYIPSDGVILPEAAFEIAEGDSVYDLLVRAAKEYGIQLEIDGSNGAYGFVYIAGINYLYEFDFGELSGWIYFVNGTAPSVGCGEYKLADGDAVEWLYTCELGNDLD